MMRISSRATFFHKRIFPLIWFGGLGLFSLLALFGEATGSRWMFVVLPVGMAISGFYFVKRQIWPLMDTVYDGGDYLVVTRSGDEERIPLADIINVNAMSGRPSHVTLRLRQPGRFGSDVAFLPEATSGFNRYAKNPIIEEFITRVDRARLEAVAAGRV